MKKIFYTLVSTIVFVGCTEDTTETCDCSEYAQSSSVNAQSTTTSNLSLTEDILYQDEDVEIPGGLNLNGYTFEAVNSCVTILGDLNGGGTFIATSYYVSGNIQNNPTIEGEELSVSCVDRGVVLSTTSFEFQDECSRFCNSN